MPMCMPWLSVSINLALQISKESSMVAVQTPHANTYLDNLLQVMPLDDRKQPLPPLEVNLPWPVVAFVATDNPKAREAYTSPSGGVVMSVVQVPSDYPVKQFIVKKAVVSKQGLVNMLELCRTRLELHSNK